MNRRQLMALVNRPTLLGSLSTADAQGNLNAAVVGSARMIDEETLLLGLGDNRSLRYLRSHPRAVFLACEPGPTLLAWQGARLYLEVAAIGESGPLFERVVNEVKEAAGEMAARTIRAAVSFRITAARPLIDRDK